ncbi:hypothetical protein EON65_04255 [archaeon]|nr:MAG: hypothetical protein EON65_04255 [archaeon]
MRTKSYNRKEIDNSKCAQTGLQPSIVGYLLYICVMLTLVGLQVVLLLLTMAYYFILNKATIKRDTPDMGFGWNPFDDAPNALYAFIIAWGVAFGWVLFFKRPQSLYCAFLRRSELRDATTVAVFIPDSRGIQYLVRDGEEWVVTKYFQVFNVYVDRFLAFIFSEPEHDEPGQTGHCTVQIDEFGVRYFEFHMRRYNYQPESDSFVPAELNITGTAADLLKMKAGLDAIEEKKRVALIGPNVIATDDSSFLHIMLNEFSRVFYVYQNFMAWSWLNYSYWHMGIVNTLVYTIGGLSVSYVNYKNAQRKLLCYWC